MARKLPTWLALACVFVWHPGPLAAESPNRITILVDAFGTPSSLKQDWGYAALVEYNGKRILFDTGNNSEGFTHNIRARRVDLTRLDAVVISHRHGDHTDGLRHLLVVNPRVKIYAPNDEYFGGPTPPVFFRRPVPSLPADQRYFGGKVPKKVPHGSPWREANLLRLDSTTEIAPGIRVVQNVSQTRQFSETPELSLVIQTPNGQVVLVGCSHPGIEQILASVRAKEVPVHLVAGGLHLVTTPDAEVDRLTAAVRDEWKVERIAPGHCTGEVGFAALRRVYGPRYTYAGVGTVIRLP